jgi:hypothetical protein
MPLCRHCTTRFEEPWANLERGNTVANRLVRIILFTGLILGSLFLVYRLRGFYWPGNQQGYEPIQPIAFSHQLHAGKLQISCLYCHFGAEKSKHAGFPAASLCMNCHGLVTAPRETVLREFQQAQQAGRPAQPVVSAELRKLYDALGLDDKLQPDPTRQAMPIPWVKVHNLPAFSCFDHRPHVLAGVDCQQCHGPVETMDRVRQVADLSMGWCVNCHRDTAQTGVAGKKARPSTDCSACHY